MPLARSGNSSPTAYIPSIFLKTTQKLTIGMLCQILQQWKLDPSILIKITTDNGSNVKLACELLEWMGMAQLLRLNLAVTKGLNDSRIQHVLRVCRALVASFSKSWKKQRDLVEAQEQKNFWCSDTLGSCYDMVEKVLEQLEAIKMVLCDDRSSPINTILAGLWRVEINCCCFKSIKSHDRCFVWWAVCHYFSSNTIVTISMTLWSMILATLNSLMKLRSESLRILKWGTLIQLWRNCLNLHHFWILLHMSLIRMIFWTKLVSLLFIYMILIACKITNFPYTCLFTFLKT